MTSATSTNTANRKNLAKAKRAGDKLCAALAAWVKTLGGRPVVAGPIIVRGVSKHHFDVVVRITGSAPDLEKYGEEL